MKFPIHKLKALLAVLVIHFLISITAHETIKRTISAENRTFIFPRFTDDSMVYSVCDQNAKENGEMMCNIVKMENIFDKNAKTQSCDVKIENLSANETFSNGISESLGTDHAILIFHEFDYADFIVVRFKDCKYAKSNFEYKYTSERNEKFKELGVDLEKLYEGGFAFFSNCREHICVQAAYDRKGNLYRSARSGVYALTSNTDKADELSKKELNAESNLRGETSQHFLFNENGEMKLIYDLKEILPFMPSSGAHDLLTVFTPSLGNTGIIYTISQFDQSGKSIALYMLNASEENLLSIYNLPDGGFYLLTTTDILRGANVTKVNVTGERQLVMNLNDEHMSSVATRSQHDFYEPFYLHENAGKLCLAWIDYDYEDGYVRKMDLYSKCLEEN